MYYDAPPEVGHALLASAPITVDRGGQRLEGCADANAVDELPGEEVAALFAVMESKYEERNQATSVFYAVLGGERDRIGLVLRINECLARPNSKLPSERR